MLLSHPLFPFYPFGTNHAAWPHLIYRKERATPLPSSFTAAAGHLWFGLLQSMDTSPTNTNLR